MTDELNRFKTEINIIDYAASLGYQIDKEKSSESCTIMRKNTAKISISTGLDDHGVFYDFRKEEGGSIIDFVKSETGKNLGQVRQELRPWIGMGYLSSKGVINYPKPHKTSKDRQKVGIEFAKAKSIETHRYIENRGIKQCTLKSKRFFGRIYGDDYGNAIFPHYDHDGISGFSIINRNYKGFSQDGEKGLWFSNYSKDDSQIVLCESVIDALSYHQLKGDTLSCYFSIDGQVTQKQLMLIDSLISKNRNKKIVLAFDNDHAGRKYISRIQSRQNNANNIIPDLPENDEQDWNDVLNEVQKHSKGIISSRVGGSQLR
ncbi:MAG: DUF3991 domain-containing protein [Bacteroidetes bacterium]|nr:DUF3991 domain-containing protein [Bacteroidota bacterium]